jgi:methionine sulfoxide reductase heme-binding subunit
MIGSTDPSQHIWWLTSRALGVVAIALISLSVGLGLALSGRLGRKSGLPAKLKRLHEALALSGLIMIAAHGIVLLWDPYLRPGLAGIALPFALGSQPVWTGVGIVAGWLAAIVGLSFYVRRLIGVAVWRWLHRWTLAVYALALAHAFGSGTDARSAWFVGILGATAVPAVFAAVYRALPADRQPTKRTPGCVASPAAGGSGRTGAPLAQGAAGE